MIIKNEYVVFVDCDDTLVMHVKQSDIPIEDLVCVKDTVLGDKGEFPYITMQRNRPMIRLVHEEIARGATIIIFSRGGYQWAENVAIAVGLYPHKNVIIMSKPLAYLDDKPVEEWLKYRVYIAPDVVYKDVNRG